MKRVTLLDTMLVYCDGFSVVRESWPLARPFRIARGMKTQAEVICMTLRANGKAGRGECVPYARYGESLDSVQAQLEIAWNQFAALAQPLSWPATTHWLRHALPAGAARCAFEAAALDLLAKSNNQRVWQLLGLAPPVMQPTACTVSLADPTQMAREATQLPDGSIIKLKLGGTGDEERMAAVREAKPHATLVVDVNEGWSSKDALDMLQACIRCGISWVEQPVAASDDACLRERPSGLIVCADEAIHTADQLDALRDRYDAINIKTDKTGGLSCALELAQAARAIEMQYMVGCMVSTSLAIAPAMLLANGAAWLDLDGPLWLAQDREEGAALVAALRGQGSEVFAEDLWG